jgi:Trk K+ transport system NAD-binding subunit
MILNKKKVLIYDTYNGVGRYIIKKIRNKIVFEHCTKHNELTKFDLSKFDTVIFINNEDIDLINLILVKKEIESIIIASRNSENDHILKLLNGVVLLDLKETNKEFIDKLHFLLNSYK